MMLINNIYIVKGVVIKLENPNWTNISTVNNSVNLLRKVISRPKTVIQISSFPLNLQDAGFCYEHTFKRLSLKENI